MNVHRKAISVASTLLGVAILAGVGGSQSMAQSPPQQPSPEAAIPALPDGFIVTPARPLVPLPRFEFQHGTPDSAESPSAPNSQPLGGCRYEERKLELMV